MQSEDVLSFIIPVLETEEQEKDTPKEILLKFMDVWMSLMEEHRSNVEEAVTPSGLNAYQLRLKIDYEDHSYVYVVLLALERGTTLLPRTVSFTLSGHLPGGENVMSHVYEISGDNLQRRDIYGDGSTYHFDMFNFADSVTQLAALKQSEFDADREIAEEIDTEIARSREAMEIAELLDLNSVGVGRQEVDALAALLADAAPVSE